MPIHNPPPLLYFSVDVVEIGERRRKIGEILRVKPLGALAMIDEGELDWKIVAISLDDPKAALVNDVDDVEKHFPVSNILKESQKKVIMKMIIIAANIKYISYRKNAKLGGLNWNVGSCWSSERWIDSQTVDILFVCTSVIIIAVTNNLKSFR